MWRGSIKKPAAAAAASADVSDDRGDRRVNGDGLPAARFSILRLELKLRFNGRPSSDENGEKHGPAGALMREIHGVCRDSDASDAGEIVASREGE